MTVGLPSPKFHEEVRGHIPDTLLEKSILPVVSVLRVLAESIAVGIADEGAVLAMMAIAKVGVPTTLLVIVSLIVRSTE